MRRPRLFLMACAAVVVLFATAPVQAIDATVGTGVFVDEFTGNPDSVTLDATKWTSVVSGNNAVLYLNTNGYAGTNVEIYSAGGGGTNGTPNAHMSTVNALDFSASTNDWWAQVVFKFPVQGGKWLAPNAVLSSARQYNILSGQDAISPTAQGNNQGFDLRAVRYGAGLWGLAWNGIDDTDLRIAEILDDNVGTGYAFSDTQAYSVSVHRKSDNTVDIYFDKTTGDGSASDLIATKPLLGPSGGANPLGLTSGDWSLSVAGYLLVDAVRVGTGPVIVVPGDYNDNGTVDGADYVVWRKNQGGPGGSASVGDSEPDGDVDDADYAFWRDRFGNPTPGSGSGLGNSAVPEPTTAVLLPWAAGALFAAVGVRRRTKFAGRRGSR
ncbi:MAG: hypothetical protein WD229_02040 [Pirellulales bacterium]